MRSFTLFGFSVLVNPTWLLVFALLIVSLVTSIAGTGPANLPGPQALGVSVIVVVLFLASIGAHELAHAVVGRWRGLPVRRLHVMTLGRAEEAEPTPSSPLTEALVAIAGPVLSGLIGIALVAIALTFPADTGVPASYVYWAIYWLGLANLALALFHLVPVLPLDGGRIVRAVSWAISRDLDRATRWASLVGRGFAYLMMGAGLYVAVFADIFIGVWLLLLGWFAARLSRDAVDRRRMETLAAGLSVDDATDSQPVTVPASLTVDTLIAQDEQGDGPGVYPVVDGGRLVGIAYLARIQRRFRADWTTERVKDVMTPIERVPSLRPGEPLMHAVERLEATRIDAIPVLEPGDPPTLAGLVTRALVMDRLRARRALIDARS
jgi:Zn-dependent protease